MGTFFSYQTEKLYGVESDGIFVYQYNVFPNAQKYIGIVAEILRNNGLSCTLVQNN